MTSTPLKAPLDSLLTAHRLFSFHPSDLEMLADFAASKEARARILQAFETVLKQQKKDPEGRYDAYCLGAHLRSIWFIVQDRRKVHNFGVIRKGAIDHLVWYAFLGGFTGIAFHEMDEKMKDLERRGRVRDLISMTPKEMTVDDARPEYGSFSIN